MDNLKRNRLNVNPNPFQKRNTTLGSINNVLQPNTQKIKVTDRIVKDNRETRVSNITSGIGFSKTGWINKNN